MPTTVRVACLQLRAHELEEAPEALDDALAAVDLAAAEGGQILVLPEMAYPAYFLHSRAAYANAATTESAVTAAFAARARRHGVVIVVGMGATRGTQLYNSAVLFGPDGVEIGRYAKSFLWQFDRHWFSPGDAYPTFETPFGRVGVLICADSRAPEVARLLALGGAQVLLDPTAWVSGGRSTEALSSPQIEYLMPARAIENGLPIAAANKWGAEAGTIIYCGRSRVINARGETVAEGPSEGDCCVVADIELAEPHFPAPRRPGLYEEIVRPTEQLPVTKLLAERLSMQPPSPRIAAVQMERGSLAGFLPAARRIALAASRQDTNLLLFPDVSAVLDESAFAHLSDLSLDTGSTMLGFTLAGGAPGQRRREFLLFSAGKVLLKHAQSHLGAADVRAGLRPGEALSPVLETPAGRVAVMLGDEGLAPEVARCLMLGGADVLLWPAATARAPLLTIARARADENRVYVALASLNAETGGCAVIAPNGNLLATAPLSLEMAAGAQVHPAFARWKEMATGTHVVLSRQPETYHALVEE